VKLGPPRRRQLLAIDSRGHLTVVEGSVIKFLPGGSMSVDGVLTAEATTPTSMIFFTSVADDSNGGDTNGDGYKAGHAGDWNGITVRRSGSTFSYVGFFYAGGAATGDDSPALRVDSGLSVTIQDSVLANIRPATIALNAPPALDLFGAAAASVVQRNAFFENLSPIGINPTISLDDSNLFEMPGVRGPSLYNAVMVKGCDHVVADTTWSGTKVPLVIGDPTSSCKGIGVNGGGHLTVGPGVTMKFFIGGSVIVEVGGSFSVDSDAYLTAIADDYLNDSNHDGGSIAPAAGDWNGVMIRHPGPSETCWQTPQMHYQVANLAIGDWGW
jgi:hypothetical protein